MRNKKERNKAEPKKKKTRRKKERKKRMRVKSSLAVGPVALARGGQSARCQTANWQPCRIEVA